MNVLASSLGVAPPLPARRAPAGVRARIQGFTLLEVCLAMGLMAMLATAIFTLASSSVEVSAELVEYQDKEAMRRRFIDLCRANFESLPAHGSAQLETVENGEFYTTYLSLIDYPHAFTFAGFQGDVSRVVLVSEVDTTGFMNVYLHYLDADGDQAWADGNRGKALEQSQGLRLLGRLRQAGWRFYDRSRRRWEETWDEKQGDPDLIELILELEGDPGPERLVFSVPASEAVAGAGAGFSIQQPQASTPESQPQPPSSSDGQPLPPPQPPPPAP